MTNLKSITTKIGDKGRSRLFSGENVPKNSPRLEAYGAIDELVAILGIARYHATNKETRDSLLFVQRALFTVASELATTQKKLNKLKKRVDISMLNTLEERRVALEQKTVIPHGFVIPGNALATAHIEHARTVARRCERKVVSLFQSKFITNELLIVWLNRLSDYLYLLARLEEDEPTMA